SLGGATPALIALGAVLAVLFTAAFRMLLARASLPTLSLPFIAAAWTVALTGRMLPAPPHALTLAEPWQGLPPGLLQGGWLDVPAAILFMHGAAAGVLLLAAILWHSRIALLLAGVGAAAAAFARMELRAGLDYSVIDLTASFNAML